MSKIKNEPTSINKTIAGFLTCIFALILLCIYSQVTGAKVNPVADTISFDVQCASGRMGKGKCPDGQEPPAAALVSGWDDVTTALNATGAGSRIDIGGGSNTYNDLSGLDPGTLTPGSVVNIYHRAQPYSTKFVFTQDGTEANPIIINGVTDANGNRPEINCASATTQNMQDGHANWVAPYGCWTFTYSRDGGTYIDPTEHYEIRNLEMYGAHPDNTSDGEVSYVDGASAIRFNEANHIKLIGNIFRDNGNGIYVHSGNRANSDFQLQGNKFIGNGVVGSYTEHNLYFQVVGSTPFSNIVEGNYFAPLVTGALGTSSMKHRGTDLIFRYNTIICEERCLDLVELQDTLPDHVYTNFTAQEILDRYRTSYIYGNQFWANDAADHTSGYLIHVGMDTGTNQGQTFGTNAGNAAGEVMARGYQSPVYFYHNSIYVDSTTSFYKSIFDCDAVSAGTSDYTVEIVAANNVIYATDSSAPYDTNLSHLRHTGQLTYQAKNYVYMPNMANSVLYEGRDDGAGDDPQITIIGGSGSTLTQATTGLDPLFTNVSSGDLDAIDLAPQTGSSVIGNAATLPSPMSNYPVTAQPIIPSQGGGVQSRSATTNLGAYE